MHISRSAKLFQERRIPADQLTLRLPGPRSNFDANRVHFLPLSPPYPIPDVLHAEQRNAPDNAHTSVWPWPTGSVTLSG